MLQNQALNSPQPLYYADAQWCEQVRNVRRKLYEICGHCTRRMVRVQTIDGHTYEGTVVGIDSGCLRLAVRDQRFFGAGFILPLVLYELLVITLLI